VVLGHGAVLDVLAGPPAQLLDVGQKGPLLLLLRVAAHESLLSSSPDETVDPIAEESCKARAIAPRRRTSKRLPGREGDQPPPVLEGVALEGVRSVDSEDVDDGRPGEREPEPGTRVELGVRETQRLSGGLGGPGVDEEGETGRDEMEELLAREDPVLQVEDHLLVAIERVQQIAAHARLSVREHL